MLDQDAKDKRVANDHHKSEGEDNQEEPLQIEPLGAHCGVEEQNGQKAIEEELIK